MQGSAILSSLPDYCKSFKNNRYMSPVSPVFNTKVTVSIQYSPIISIYKMFSLWSISQASWHARATLPTGNRTYTRIVLYSDYPVFRVLDIHSLNKTLMVFPPKEPLVYRAVLPNAAFNRRDPSSSCPWNTSSQALIN